MALVLVAGWQHRLGGGADGPGDLLTFHHLGVASSDLAADVQVLSGLGYTAVGEAFTDTVQGVHGLFMQGPGPQLEVLEQLPGSKVLEGWLSRGVRIYHQAFLTDELDVELLRLQGQGAMMVSRPTPAVAFGGRQICFLMLRERMLVELIEAEQAALAEIPPYI